MILLQERKEKEKLKFLIQQVNDDIKLTKGTIVYLDKNNKHMYELSNQIRLIVVPEFNVTDTDMFLGFIAGIISQDHDLDKIYLDSFLTTACIKDNLDYAVEKAGCFIREVWSKFRNQRFRR